MSLSKLDKLNIKRALVDSLCREPEISKIVVFGSFLDTADPHDLDVAIFQNSSQAYLPLALRYRKMTRTIARRIPLDIVPVKADAKDCDLMVSIAHGEVIFER